MSNNVEGVKTSNHTVEVLDPWDIEWKTKRLDDTDTITEAQAEGYAIEIVYDLDPLNPRTEYDSHIGTLIGSGNLSDENVPTISSERELWNHVAWDLGITVPDEYDEAEGDNARQQFEDKVRDKVFILPVYKYEHSGVAFKTTPFRSIWDSGQIGWIYVPKTRAEERLSHYEGEFPEGRGLKQQVHHILKSEVQTYSAWRNGEVYGFKIHDTNEEEVIDLCYGFYDIDHCKEDAFLSLGYIVSSVIQ